jgi:hypothetical protein
MSSSRLASLLPLAALVLAACPRDKKAEVPTDSAALAAAMATDTTPPADLSTLTSNIPAAAPDTFKRRTAAQIAADEGRRRGAASAGNIPDAPQALMTAVERELAFQRFCYEEFGQKADPSLAGNVAMVVTIGSGGVTDAKVANSRWTSKAAGAAVNRCLSEKAKVAIKVEPGAVKAGRYVVPLSFRGS